MTRDRASAPSLTPDAASVDLTDEWQSLFGRAAGGRLGDLVTAAVAWKRADTAPIEPCWIKPWDALR